MTVSDAQEFIAHHGVKGMKWGVRREQSTARSTAGTPDEGASKKQLKGDKKWQKAINTRKTAIAVHNASADHFNAHLDAVNAKHRNADLINRPNSPESKAYLKDIETLADESYAVGVKKVVGVSPSGNRTAIFDPSTNRIQVRWTQDLQHDAMEMMNLTLQVKIENGKITGVRQISDVIAQDAVAEDILEHFGIKGQKWGVIRDPSGSHGGPKGDANPLKDVTDEDLRKMVNRLQMEQQFRSLTEKTANKTAIDHGAAFMKSTVLPAVKVAIAGAITAQVASVLKAKKK